MSKHTPGPWEIEDNTWLPLDIKTESGRFICAVDCDEVWGEFGETVRDPTEEQLANAYLIAAAPKLLAALKSLLNDIDLNHGIGWHNLVGRSTRAALGAAIEAIDKAEGKV